MTPPKKLLWHICRPSTAHQCAVAHQWHWLKIAAWTTVHYWHSPSHHVMCFLLWNVSWVGSRDVTTLWSLAEWKCNLVAGQYPNEFNPMIQVQQRQGGLQLTFAACLPEGKKQSLEKRVILGKWPNQSPSKEGKWWHGFAMTLSCRIKLWRLASAGSGPVALCRRREAGMKGCVCVCGIGRLEGGQDLWGA